MNLLERKMLDTLKDLRENHHVIGIKAEFEAEGTRMEEALRLKEVVTKAGLDLFIKIGGCEAIKDMFDARTIGVKGIVGPMIETDYAMTKYVKATHFVFPKEEREEMEFLINVETKTGVAHLDAMIARPEFKEITGVVLGRVDMTGSMGLTREDINSEAIFNIAHAISEKTYKAGKKMIIGGGVSAHSLPFFKRLPAGALTRFETRKIIFDAQTALQDSHADKGILKAVGFELMWLKNKRDFYGMIFKEDAARIEMLEARYKKLIEEAGGRLD
ncbi:MAG: aldolase/citrate lyase family protein [Elusimicrobiaceae bacterium]|nr:aldolase/citrate lyase family protein [Elusimicrobiaceae bacterium]